MDIKMATQTTVRQSDQELDRLVSYLKGLDEAGWQRPSACEGWTIRDVIDHVGSGSLYFQPIVENTLVGQPAPAFDPVARQAMTQSFKGLDNQQSLKKFEQETRILMHDFLQGSAEQLAITVPLFGRQISVGVIAGIRLNELVLHGWDIYVMDDPQAELDAQSAAVLLPATIVSVQRFIQPERTAQIPGLFQFNLSGPQPSVVTIDTTQNQPTITTNPISQPPTLTVEMTQAQFTRFVWGRFDWDKAIEDGTVRYSPTDNQEVIRQLGQIFKSV